MSEKSPKRKSFFCRLPRDTYCKLRRLAKMGEPDSTEDVIGILFRFHAQTHRKLKQLALARSLNGQDSTMQGVLIDLITNAKVKDLDSRHDMHDVARQLIIAAEQ